MAVKEKYHEHTKAHLCNLQFGPRHRKADHIIAILLELDIIFAIPMIFHHLGLNRCPVARSVQNKAKQGAEWGMRTRKRGIISSGANSPVILAFLQKGGQGQKIFIFAIFFGTHFCIRHEANN